MRHVGERGRRRGLAPIRRADLCEQAGECSRRGISQYMGRPAAGRFNGMRHPDWNGESVAGMHDELLLAQPDRQLSFQQVHLFRIARMAVRRRLEAGRRESLDQIEKEHGFAADYLRIRAYPFAHEIHDFVASHERVYVVEQDRDAQLASLLKLDLPADQAVKLRSILHYNGLPVDARTITEEFVTKEGL